MAIKKLFTNLLTIGAASTMLFVSSCDKTTSPTAAGGTTTALVANPTSISVLVNSTGFVSISDGTKPYSIKSNSDTTKVRASISGTTLSVTGLAVGIATIVVKDSAGTSTVSVPVTVASMIATPNSVSVVKGSNATATLSGGSLPYTIQTAPDAAVATATISGSTLTVTGVAVGSTSVTVKDNSTTAKTVSIPITVTASGGGGGGGTFTTAGTLSFSSGVGNFSANGIFNESTTSGSGAGGFKMDTLGQSELIVYGYKYNSSTSIDLAILIFMDTSPITTTTYVYPPTGTSSKLVMISYLPNVNPSSSTFNGYIISSATAAISAISSTNAVGTFSGTGSFVANNVADPSKPITISNGAFNIPVISGTPPKQTDSRIETIVRKYLNNAR